MHSYDTLSQAVNDLQRRGYTDELVSAGHCLLCNARQMKIMPEELQIDEFYRFEGETNPGDESIVYAISSVKHGIKGVLVNGFGPSASTMVQELVAMLPTH